MRKPRNKSMRKKRLPVGSLDPRFSIAKYKGDRTIGFLIEVMVKETLFMGHIEDMLDKHRGKVKTLHVKRLGSLHISAEGAGLVPFVRDMHDDLFTCGISIVFRITVYL